MRSCATCVSVIDQVDVIPNMLGSASSLDRFRFVIRFDAQTVDSFRVGRVVGELHWHVVGVEPPKQVSQELNEVRDEGTSNTLPGFVSTSSFPQL